MRLRSSIYDAFEPSSRVGWTETRGCGGRSRTTYRIAKLSAGPKVLRSADLLHIYPLELEPSFNGWDPARRESTQLTGKA